MLLLAVIHGALVLFSLRAVQAQMKDSIVFLRGTTTIPVAPTPSPTRSDTVHYDNAGAHIVGGAVLTTEHRIPFFGTAEGAPILCGASLIWPDVFLSAAHCVDAFTETGRRVHIGGIHRDPWYDAEQTLTIRKHLQHPGYGAAGAGAFDYDIMLIFTHELAQNSTPLAIVNTDPSQPHVGQQLFMAGFGSTNDHAVHPTYTAVLSHTLKESHETVVNDTTCITSQWTDFQLKANHSICTKLEQAFRVLAIPEGH